MKFSKFTKLTNTYDNKTLDIIREKGFDKQMWVVVEKLDGANFSFYYNGKGKVSVASRNKFVDGGFFNCQQVVDKYSEAVKEHYDLSVEKGCISLGDTLTIFGELIGDGINSRVKYKMDEGMTRAFYAFDYEVNGESMGYMYAYDNLDTIPLAPLLSICSFEDALQYNNTFKSHLSPDIDGDNWSEGVAISPTTPQVFDSGSQVWLKSKSDKFKEKGVKQEKKEVNLNEFDNTRLSTLLSYVNNSRVLSTLSKFGDVTQSDFGLVLKLIIEDILEEYESEVGGSATIGVGNWKVISSTLSKEVSKEMREEFLKRL